MMSPDTAAGLAPLPSVRDRLRTLQPSNELLGYYRQKISEFDGEHADMMRKLERYKSTHEETHKTEWMLAQREEEIKELQKTLSDVQVYLFQEREHVLRLYAENDRLKILELEDRKKIQHLLGLTQPVEYESTYFRAPSEPEMVTSLAPRHPTDGPTMASGGEATRKPAGSKKKKKSDFGNDMLPSDELSDRERNETLLLTVEALKAQLEDHARLANEKTAALLEDRRIREEETRASAERSAEQIKEVTDKFHNTQALLYDSTRDYLELKFEQRTRERLWTEEKERLLERIEELKDDLDGQQSELRLMAAATEALQAEREQEQDLARMTQDAGTNAYMPGGRSEVGLGESSRRGTSAAASSVGEYVPVNVDHQESLAEMYREQCIKLEDELCRFREQKAAAAEIQGGRSEKLLKRLAVMKSRYEALERRRSLEAEGYKNAIKILRKKLSTVEHQLYRLATQNHNGDAELAMLRDVGAAAARSKKALGGVQHLRTQINQLENDIRHTHGARSARRRTQGT